MQRRPFPISSILSFLSLLIVLPNVCGAGRPGQSDTSQNRRTHGEKKAGTASDTAPKAGSKQEESKKEVEKEESVYNVTDFGASPSAPDNTAAVQAAIRACQKQGGGVVQFPSGTFRFTGTLRMEGNNVWIRGRGRSATTLNFDNGAADGIIVGNRVPPQPPISGRPVPTRSPTSTSPTAKRSPGAPSPSSTTPTSFLKR